MRELSQASEPETERTDNLTPEQRRSAMRAVKGKHTSLERRVRAMLAGAGLGGWVLNYDQIPGKPDIAFPDHRIAIFIDGCFWHGCPECNRPLPQANREYWARKIEKNVIRDRRYNEVLIEIGWRVFRVWEHQLRKDSERHAVLEKISCLLSELH